MTGHLKSVYSLIGFITSDDFSAWSAKNQALFLPLPLPLRSGSRPANVQALAAPHFSEALRECSVREGRDASFQGVVTGSRPLSVSWLHNGECAITKTNVPLLPPITRQGRAKKVPRSEGCSILLLFVGKRVRSRNTSFQNGVASLTLTQCSRGDAGTYTCEAENTAGKRSSSAVLHITGKAR